MSAITKKTKIPKKHLYKLLDNFNEKDFHAVKTFAEFLNKARKEKNDVLLGVLENAAYEVEELNEKTLKDIEKARKEYKEGKTVSLERIMKELKV